MCRNNARLEFLGSLSTLEAEDMHQKNGIHPGKANPNCCYDPKMGASLGCGTWILLVIVLAIFSDGIRDRITGNRSRLSDIESRVRSVEKKLDLVLESLSDNIDEESEPGKPDAAN